MPKERRKVSKSGVTPHAKSFWDRKFFFQISSASSSSFCLTHLLNVSKTRHGAFFPPSFLFYPGAIKVFFFSPQDEFSVSAALIFEPSVVSVSRVSFSCGVSVLNLGMQWGFLSKCKWSNRCSWFGNLLGRNMLTQ